MPHLHDDKIGAVRVTIPPSRCVYPSCRSTRYCGSRRQPWQIGNSVSSACTQNTRRLSRCHLPVPTYWNWPPCLRVVDDPDSFHFPRGRSRSVIRPNPVPACCAVFQLISRAGGPKPEVTSACPGFAVLPRRGSLPGMTSTRLGTVVQRRLRSVPRTQKRCVPIRTKKAPSTPATPYTQGSSGP